MPPVILVPVTAPLEEEFRIRPSAVFCPTRPPVVLLPATLPENEQFSIVPAFHPARPPAASQVLEALTVPLTFKSSMRASFCTRWNNPARESPSDRLRPLMVWPFPWNVPPKLAMGENATPSSDTSASSSTVKPSDHVSSLQLSESVKRSSADETEMVFSSSSAASAVTGSASSRLRTRSKERSFFAQLNMTLFLPSALFRSNFRRPMVIGISAVRWGIVSRRV